jgi:hypothetical protein
MPQDAISIVGAELEEYIQRNSGPPSGRFSSDPFEIDIAMCCVKLGDVHALGVWTEELEAALASKRCDDRAALVSGLKHLHSRWKHLESTPGVGALLDYRHCLKSSPAKVVGQDRIENATRFQLTRNRVPGDPRWAFSLEIE